MATQDSAIIKSQLFQELIDNIPDVIYFKDKDGHLILVNKAHAHGLGLKPEDVIGKTDFDFFPKEQATLMTADDMAVMKSATALVDVIERTTQPDGSHHCVSTTKIPRKDSNGNVIGIMGITRDITQRVLLQEQQQRDREQSQRQLKQLNDQIEFEKHKLEEILNVEEQLNSIIKLEQLVEFIVETTTRILSCDKCSLMLIDEQSGALCIRGQRGLNEKVLVEEAISIDDSLANVIATQGRPVLVTNIEEDQRFPRKKRESYRTKSFISVPMKLQDNLVGVINIADKKVGDGVFDQLDFKILITLSRQIAVAIDNARLYRELKYLTISDPLTHMYNYRHFAKCLDDEIKRMKRYNEDLSLIMIDVDDFKGYNDTFGHPEGDKLLKLVSNAINENTRDVDIACRYAGDEFVVILPKTNIEQAQVVALKIKNKVSQLPLKRKATLSIGIAQCHKEMDRHDLVLKADSALYDAKRAGRNCIAQYNDAN